MEAFLLTLPIVIGTSLLIVLYRFNTLFSRFQTENTGTLLTPNTLHLMNAAGKWFTAMGAIATLPLVLVLLFSPDISSSSVPWVITFGTIGCGALFIAAIILAITVIGECLLHKSSVQQIITGFYQIKVKRWLDLYGLKALGWIAVSIGVVIFMPIIKGLVIAVGYIACLFVAARLGMLDDLGEYKEVEYYHEDYYEGNVGSYSDYHTLL